MIEFGSSQGWTSGPVIEALGRRERLKGLRPRPDGRSMAFRTRSVHGFGMREPIQVMSIGKDLSVRKVRVLRPGRLIIDLRAARMVEFPMDRSLPERGTLLSIVVRCPEP